MEGVLTAGLEIFRLQGVTGRLVGEGGWPCRRLLRPARETRLVGGGRNGRRNCRKGEKVVNERMFSCFVWLYDDSGDRELTSAHGSSGIRPVASFSSHFVYAACTIARP